MTEEPKKLGWEQQAISKVAKMALSRIVEAEQITIQVETTLKKIIGGEIDAIAIHLQQFLMRKSLTVAMLRLEIGRVTVNTREARRGKILLIHPATGRLSLAIDSQSLAQSLFEDVCKRLRNENQLSNRNQLINEDKASKEIAAKQFFIQKIECFLTNSDSFLIKIEWRSKLDPLQQTTLLITPSLSTTTTTVELTTEVCEYTALAPAILSAVQASLIHILNLQDFADRGTQFEVQSIAISSQQLVLQATAKILEFPSK